MIFANYRSKKHKTNTLNFKEELIMDKYVAFIMAPFKSHLLPAFKISKILQNRGIQSVYLSTIKMKPEIEGRGFFFQNSLLFNDDGKKLSSLEIAESIVEKYNPVLFLVETSFWNWGLYLKGLEKTFKMIQTWVCCDRAKSLSPLNYRLAKNKGLIQSVYNQVDWFRYNRKQIREFNSRAFVRYYEEIVAEAGLSLDTIHITKHNRVGYFRVIGAKEVILFPKEFDVPRSKKQQAIFIGPYINKERESKGLDWECLDIGNRAVVYCALGSLTEAFKGRNVFFERLISAFEQLTDAFLILAVGTGNHAFLLRNKPDNVFLCETAPQLQILKRASLFITHGGAGSVKESIRYGVPMIVYPWRLNSDMYGNADRVKLHKIGQLGDIDLDSETKIALRIKNALHDQEAKKHVRTMQKIFIEYEEKEELYVDEILS